jgi:hypothetical protein
LTAVGTRAAAILTASGYYTNCGANVRYTRREPNIEDAPCVHVWISERTAEEIKNKRARATQTITVAGFAALTYGESDEQTAIKILADIQRAVELEDATLGGLLQGSVYGLTWQADEIYQPDEGETVVGAAVTYAIPHIRKSGDPEIA